MKIIKILNLIAVVMLTLVVASCVNGDEYEIPAEADTSINPAIDIETEIANGTLELQTISQIKDLFVSDEAYQIPSDIVVMGYVVSSDETGNFYQEFYMQDAPSNPTAGIKVALGIRDSYITYNIGRKVYIKLKDLYIGETRNDNGVLTIGGKTHFDSNTNGIVDAMTENQVPLHIFRSNIVETIVPLELTLQEINSSHIGMFITAVDVEFPEYLENKPYFNPTDQFDSARTMQSCGGFEYTNFILETSSFSSFGGLTLPSMNGNINGIISKDYEGDNLVMAINSPNDVSMNNTRCTLFDINAFDIVFEEDFESMSNSSNINGNGWTNYAEEGSFNWKTLTTTDTGNSGSKIASMGAYNSNDSSNIAWLISPVINLDTYVNLLIDFQSSNSFADNSELELLISTDWDGVEANITSATWSSLPGKIVEDSEYFRNWVSSGSINLSSYTGNAYVAFKYVGGDNSNNEDGTYELDNYRVIAN